MESNIVESFGTLCGKFGISVDLNSENVKIYLQELTEKAAKSEILTSLFWIIGLGILTFVCWLVVFKLSKVPSFDWEDTTTIFTIIGCALTVFFVIVLFDRTANIITCLTFPEKIIFNMLQSVK